MKKNVSLLSIIIVTFFLLGIILYFPTNKSTVNKNLNHEYLNESQYESQSTASQSSPKITLKTNSSTASIKNTNIIKAATTDRYHTFLIQLISKENKPRSIQNTHLIPIRGKIENKSFILRIPKDVLEGNSLQLRIIDLRTKQSRTLDASFLKEATYLPKEETFQFSIDLKSGNIQTSIRQPEKNPPFPTLLR
jgi:hypothetical protein